MKRSSLLPIACLAFILAFCPPLAANEEILEAQWEVHQVKFRYVGFSTLYTCDSIERTLIRLLKLLGARDDVRAEASCSHGSQPDRFHRVKLAFAIPVPADKTDISREIIPAKWEEVKIVSHRSRHLDTGDCELLEQFERQVLSSLQVRNISRKTRCIPRQQNLSIASLRLTTLKALEKVELEEGRSEEQMNTSQSEEK
jgi:hypothetical protein